jgi:hypothetical protein
MRDEPLCAIGARSRVVVAVAWRPSVHYIVVREQEIASRAGLIVGIDGAENSYQNE